MNRYIALQKIVELGSFTKAAEALGYTQSAMSQVISSLEDELSIKLLHRSRGGVRLTPDGADLYPFIQRAILGYQAMLEKANEIKGLESGIIRIGTVSSITCHWLPPLIKEFQTLYPNVRFVLQQGDYSSIHEWIKIGTVDFGFISLSAANGLETIAVKDVRMVAILPANHELALHDVIKLEEIADEPFILLEEGHFSESMEAFHAHNLEPNIKFTVHDDYAIMTMVEAGLGVSILSELMLRRTNYDVAKLQIEPAILMRWAIGIKDKNSMPIASKHFIEYLLANVSKLP